MIKYRTSWHEKIEAIEVIRETEKMVILPCSGRGGERREAKRSEWVNWHDTWEDARQFLLEQAYEKIH